MKLREMVTRMTKSFNSQFTNRGVAETRRTMSFEFLSPRPGVSAARERGQRCTASCF